MKCVLASIDFKTRKHYVLGLCLFLEKANERLIVFNHSKDGHLVGFN